MGIFSLLKQFFLRQAPPEEFENQEEVLRIAFKARCDHFKALLSANKRALETMASLEEAMRGERFFNMSYVRENSTTVMTNVYNMVRHLNALTKNPEHEELFSRLKDIQQKISEVLSPKPASQTGPFVLPIKKVGFSLAHEVGGKMASLGEAANQLHKKIPDGFVVTASGYQRFLEANSLQEEINRRLQLIDQNSLEAVFELSNSLQKLICSAIIPTDLEDAIFTEYHLLQKRYPNSHLAIRSSAIGEDAHGASFAGQYKTELNVTKENLFDAYKSVIASKYGAPAMTYRFNHGIPDDEVPMCVGCIVMINAKSGGVVYSANPTSTGTGIVINAVFGLPKTVVDGTNEVDIIHVSRDKPLAITEATIAHKHTELRCGLHQGIVEHTLTEKEQKQPSISEAQALELAQLALDFEDFYGHPQDIEWAYADDGTLYILQSRALLGSSNIAELIAPPKGSHILAEGGTCASPGVGAGTAFFVRRDTDMLQFPEGAVLIVEQAHSRWAPAINKASAVISAFGGAAGHLASVAREYDIPAVFGIEHIFNLITPGAEVTVDADSRRVYAGIEEEVLARKETPQKIFAGSPVHMALAMCVHYIVPLNLLYPEAPTFKPAFCNTLHDITRFCHEKAVEEMFRVDESLFAERCGKQLRYKGTKLQYYVINLENGFCTPPKGKFIDIEQVCSTPMQALWEGMVAIPWMGPPSASAKSLLAIVAESASNPDLEITSASMRMTRNYFMIDKEYCNLQASFGYHFCTVEAQAGESEQENYVSFHFKGGAANLSRRRLRVQTLADILAENGFIVDVKEDALSARAEEMPEWEACDLLRILGFLLVHTRQMDASLNSNQARIYFADYLRKGIAKTLHLCGSGS